MIHPIADFGLRIADYLRECAVLIEATEDCGFRISDCGLFAGMRREDCGLGISDCGLFAGRAVLIEANEDCGLGISDCGLFAGMCRFDRSH